MNKINSYIKKNIVLIISFLVVIQPIIDVSIGFSINYNFLVSATSLIRMSILGFLIYYLLLLSECQLKKKVIFLLTIIMLYLILFFINQGFNLYELKMALRTFYLPMLFLLIFQIKEDKESLINKKYLLITLAIYALIILLGYMTNTAFNTYNEGKIGTSGYFYAANEIGAIIAILLPLLFNYVFNKINIKKLLYFLLVISSIIILGTKTPLVSFLICSIYHIVRVINKTNYLKVGLGILIGITSLSFFITLTPIYENTKIHTSFLKITNASQIIKDPEMIDHFLLGSRLRFMKENHNLFVNSNIINKSLGMGYSNNSKLAEMDFNDIIYRQGILGFIIYFGSILCVIFFKKRKYDRDYILPVMLILLISAVVGHVLVAPAVSIFIVSILCLFIKEETR